MTSKDLSRVWLITGTSTGFGRTLAQAALVQSDRVIATARHVSKIQDLEHQYPQIASSVRLDVTQYCSDKEKLSNVRV